MTLLLCECRKDGFCRRYQREMGGRMRELCMGTNVDLGTAAAFREQWSREAGTPNTQGINPTPLLLKTSQAPGDAVAMTASIYSLHKAHPGKYITAVESYWPEVFTHNPDVTPPIETSLLLEMHYPAIHQSNQRGIHFMQGWCEHLSAALNIHVPLLTNRPHLYFADPEPPTEDFWIVCSGGKRDFTNKLWGRDKYQQVVSSLKSAVRFVQVGGAKPMMPWAASTVGSQEDSHPYLSGAEYMVGKTTLRELFDLVRRARGVLCGVSLLMHVAAALSKPSVIIAGGREPVSWNAYPKQNYLHTVGVLGCSSSQGDVGGACWRSRVVPLGDGTELDKDTCQRPVGTTPECMAMISPAMVIETILRYNCVYQKNNAGVV